MTDLELLGQYVSDRSEAAFRALVERHWGWVYAAALRQVRDQHLAEDVAQAVFMVLAMKPRSVPPARPPLAAWLFGVLRRTTAKALRADRRRRNREREAAGMNQDASDPPVEHQEIIAALDDVVARLGDDDRRAVLLRFYQQKTYLEVGTELGISEEAARKRVGRAVERLRGLYARRGVTIASAALMTAMFASAGAAPAEAASLGATAVASAALAAAKGAPAATLSSALAAGAIREMLAWKLVAAMVFLAVGATVLITVALGVTSAVQQPATRPATTSAPGTTTAADWRADAMLRRLCDYFKTARTVQVELITSPDNMPSHFSVAARPRENKLAIVLREGRNGVSLISDSKTLWMHAPTLKQFIKSPAPANLDGVVAPMQGPGPLSLADIVPLLLTRDPYAQLTRDMRRSLYVGVETVAEQQCDHIRLEGPKSVDLWVTQGDRPLVLRAVYEAPGFVSVMTSKGEILRNMTIHTEVNATNWKIDEPVEEQRFTFVPPADTKEVTRLGR